MRFAVLLMLAACGYAEPRLLLNSSDVARIKKLAADEPWAKEVVARLVREADEWPAQHVREYGLKEWALPKEGAGWSHNYVCPEHGVRLNQRQGKNLCPIDGKDYHGWPVDYVVFMQRNDANADAARDLGIVWQLTGNRAYAEKARKIFNAYSDLYLTLPIHDNDNKLDTKRGARVMSQTLSEASWLVPLAFGYDLVRDSMPAEERTRFETNVLKGAAAVIRRNDAGTSNWQSWHNAALLAAGLLTGDKELVTLAIDAHGGFKFQLRESITPDGAWLEGAWGYHFFALRPLLLTREMAVRAGIAVPEAAALKRMFDAPLACLFPDGTLPNFNDTGYTNIRSEAPYYDIGYRVFGDARYLAVTSGATRGLDSLLWGAEQLPAGKPAPLKSELMESAGVAMLRVAGSDHTLAVKFGPHGGGHGHYDKLTFVSFADGARQAADPGTQAYGAKTHTTWDKMTIAHNTISVDGKRQAEATGKLLEWNPGEDVTEIRIAAGPVYPGIEIERTLVHTAQYTLDIVDARSTDGAAHQFDWIYHNFGQLSTGLPLKEYAGLSRENGYEHLTGTKSAMTVEAWTAAFAQGKGSLALRMTGAPGTTVVSGQGLGPDLRAAVPFVMARRSGTSARFVAVYEPYQDAPKVTQVSETLPGTIQVVMAGATDEIHAMLKKFAYYRVRPK